MSALAEVIAEAAALGGDNLCVAGHDWDAENRGARACPRGGLGSQPVYRCRRCGEYDYGYTGGPGWLDCENGQCGCVNYGAE